MASLTVSEEIRQAHRELTKEQFEPNPKFRYVTGNERLLHPDVKLYEYPWNGDNEIMIPRHLDYVEKCIEEAVFAGFVVVVRSSWPTWLAQRIAVVPLRWGSPRLIINDSIAGYRWQKIIEQGGEFFRACRLWRFGWDGNTDVLVKPALKRKKCQ